MHDRFGKDAPSAPRDKNVPTFEPKVPVLPKLPAVAAMPAAIVDALKTTANLPSRCRASFAWGRCVRGTYAPSDQAREITRSRSFTKPSRVLARFSVDCGDPSAADASRIQRGFSFRLGSNGHRSDIFTQSAPVHFAATLEQMLALLDARNFETLHQADDVVAHPLPSSLAGTTYWAVHAFPATNAKGERRFIKFKIMPVAEVGGPSDVTAKPTDLLHGDLDSRIAARDVRFSVMALLDRPDDPVMDITIRWPGEDAREALRLGTIVITGVETENACDAAAFNPANLADGIGHPPDEMFAARCAAYTISQTRRR